jgi:hypothetical protein
VKKIHTEARRARTRRKLFPGPHFPGTKVPPTVPGSLAGWKAYALKTARQFAYLGLSKPKFGEL